MHRILFGALLTALGGWDASVAGTAETMASGAAVERAAAPVLVELFTSEGCSSCPPADRLLRELVTRQPVKGAMIVPISLHVDYWNDLGWKDSYSSDVFTRRQNEYATAFGSQQLYTPEMIVDGQVEFVGSNDSKARAEIAKAAGVAKGMVTISQKGSALDLEVRDVPVVGRTGVAQVFLAVTEDGLRSDVTRGENAGRILEHTAVARSLRLVGALPASDSAVTIHAVLDAPDSKVAPTRMIVVFVQEQATKRIVAVGAKRPQ